MLIASNRVALICIAVPQFRSDSNWRLIHKLFYSYEHPFPSICLDYGCLKSLEQQQYNEEVHRHAKTSV